MVIEAFLLLAVAVSAGACAAVAGSLAAQLQQFYFKGITADGVTYGPVIAAQHYGIGFPANTNTG
jgi:hypothetical protein